MRNLFYLTIVTLFMSINAFAQNGYYAKALTSIANQDGTVTFIAPRLELESGGTYAIKYTSPRNTICKAFSMLDATGATYDTTYDLKEKLKYIEFNNHEDLIKSKKELWPSPVFFYGTITCTLPTPGQKSLGVGYDEKVIKETKYFGKDVTFTMPKQFIPGFGWHYLLGGTSANGVCKRLGFKKMVYIEFKKRTFFGASYFAEVNESGYVIKRWNLWDSYADYISKITCNGELN